MAVMRAISRLRASGIPALRWHSDRAKEYASRKLQEWLTTQGVLTTMSAPEDHAANGRAEVAVREIKRAARRCLISANMASSLWPLAVRHASEQGWRRVLGRLGAPSRPLLPFGTRVQAKNREWKCRHDKAWGARTVAGRLVGPAPHTLSAYVVQLHDGTLYVSSSVHPLPDPAAPKPRYRHGSKAPLGAVRALLLSVGGSHPILQIFFHPILQIFLTQMFLKQPPFATVAKRSKVPQRRQVCNRFAQPPFAKRSKVPQRLQVRNRSAQKPFAKRSKVPQRRQVRNRFAQQSFAKRFKVQQRLQVCHRIVQQPFARRFSIPQRLQVCHRFVQQPLA